MKKPLLCHFLIGIPASGKSTFAAKLAQLEPQAVIISTDTIRGELFGNEAMQGEWAQIEARVIERISKAILCEYPVIYDATNAQAEWRIDLLGKLKDYPAVWLAWWLKAPVKKSQQWNQNRLRRVPDEVIERMAVSLRNNPPQQSEGFFAIERLSPEIEPTELAAILHRYRHSLTTKF
jgi:predicted kinase